MYLIFLPKLSEESKKELMKDPSVAFFMQAVGTYRYVLNVITSDIEEFCKRLLPGFHTKVIEVTKQIPDSYNPFPIGKSLESVKEDKKIKLDKKDLQILLQLSKNPDDSLIGLSKVKGIDRQTIKSRIKKMEEANIIQKFRYSMNISKLGYLIYFLKIKVTSDSREKILNEIRQDNYSGTVFVTHNGFILFYMPPSHRELFKFVEKTQASDSNARIEIIQNTEYFKISPSPTNELEKLLKEL